MVMKGRRLGEIGCWRTHEEPMQVISGYMGKEETVHFEAPPSKAIPIEMDRFIKWFNETGPNGTYEIRKAIIRSAVVHIYFETIHPFEDGNGRLGRALSEKALSQGLGRPVLLSLSHTIESRKNDYYDALQQAQKFNEITEWIKYFCKTVLMAQEQAETQITFTLKKVRFFDHFDKVLNERQVRVLGRMLEDGLYSFEGGMSTKKYISITRTSKPTATRDIQDLVEREIFIPLGEGRARRYEVNIDL
jgi:Fic family protein